VVGGGREANCRSDRHKTEAPATNADHKANKKRRKKQRTQTPPMAQSVGNNCKKHTKHKIKYAKKKEETKIKDSNTKYELKRNQRKHASHTDI